MNRDTIRGYFEKLEELHKDYIGIFYRRYILCEHARNGDQNKFYSADQEKLRKAMININREKEKLLSLAFDAVKELKGSYKQESSSSTKIPKKGKKNTL